MQQQHQQTPQPPTGASFSPNAITTEQIQKCLDDNKNLILAILENQNLGKFQECAQYQAILQKNLMYLAAIADAQPPTTQSQPSIPSQMPPNSMAQQANSFMQQHQQAATPQQAAGGGGGGGGSVVPKLPFQLNALRTQDQQQQLLQFQQQQQLQAQMGLRPNGMLGMHQVMQSAMAAGALMKQDASEAASGGGADGQGKSRGGGGRDS